jgi:hypothetical protein
MAITDKDTIYIDIDDEITGIIDKLNASEGKVVALVLPKRAAVLQSIVNMKLLKRAAEEGKKNLVLITAEAGLLPLAGAVGMHVAKTLTSKPEVPTPPQADDGREEEVNEADEDDEVPDFSKQALAAKPVGELAGITASVPLVGDDGVETLELDDEEEAALEGAAAAEAIAETGKKLKKSKLDQKDKKLHVPNFERFKYALIIAAILIPALVYGLYYATVVAPKATISVQTDAVSLNANLNVTLNTAAKTVDTGNGTVPAKLVTQSKTYTQQATATGTKNNGTKASGVVTFTAKNCTSIAPASDVPAGTGISSNGLTYITQKNTSFSSSKIKNGCLYFTADSDTPATAQIGGTSYNINDGSTFAVAGRNDVSGFANGSFSGGTDSVVKTLTQTDIDSAKAKITTTDTTVKQTLANQLSQAGYFPVKATFLAGSPTVTTSAYPGDTADSATVTQTVSYTMFGAKSADLNKLIDNALSSQIDTSKQSIINEGLEAAVFNVDTSDTKTAQLALQSKATAGAALDESTIKSTAAGLKAGAVKSHLETLPGVTGVQVKLSPFWVTSVPKKPAKITVNISKPAAAPANDTSN